MELVSRHRIEDERQGCHRAIDIVLHCGRSAHFDRPDNFSVHLDGKPAATRASAGMPAKSDGSFCRDARGGLFLQGCSRKKDHRFLIFHQLFLVVEAIHFEGLPRFAKIRPKTSAAFLSIPAAFNASMRSCPGGMSRAA
jgi:hypothetical protein